MLVVEFDKHLLPSLCKHCIFHGYLVFSDSEISVVVGHKFFLLTVAHPPNSERPKYFTVFIPAPA